jgi:hypothetical protein
LTAGLLLLEFVIFTIFASGEEQPWNRFHEQEHRDSAIELAHQGKRINK